MNIFKKIILSLRYANLISRVNDDRENKDYINALENLQKASEIKLLDGESLLKKYHINMHLERYSDSVVDAKKAIQQINKRVRYSDNDRKYLLYCAGTIGVYSLTKGYKIKNDIFDDQFMQAIELEYELSKVSKNLISAFSFKRSMGAD